MYGGSTTLAPTTTPNDSTQPLPILAPDFTMTPKAKGSRDQRDILRNQILSYGDGRCEEERTHTTNFLETFPQGICACSLECAKTCIYSFNTCTCAPIPSQRIAWSTLAFASTVTLAHRCDWLMTHSSPSTQLAPMVDPRTTQDSPNCTRGKWVREVQQMRRHRSQRYEKKVPVS